MFVWPLRRHVRDLHEGEQGARLDLGRGLAPGPGVVRVAKLRGPSALSWPVLTLLEVCSRADLDSALHLTLVLNRRWSVRRSCAVLDQPVIGAPREWNALHLMAEVGLSRTLELVVVARKPEVLLPG